MTERRSLFRSLLDMFSAREIISTAIIIALSLVAFGYWSYYNRLWAGIVCALCALFFLVALVACALKEVAPIQT